MQKGWELNKDQFDYKTTYDKAWDTFYCATDTALNKVNSMLKTGQSYTPYMFFADNSSFFCKAQGIGTVISYTLSMIVDQRANESNTEVRLNACAERFHFLANDLEKKYDAVTIETVRYFKGLSRNRSNTKPLQKAFYDLMK